MNSLQLSPNSLSNNVKYLRSGNFHCKNISVICINHKKNRQYILQSLQSAYYYREFHSTDITSLETASSSMSARTDGKHVTTFSVYNRSHILTTTVHVTTFLSSVSQASHKRSNLSIVHVFLVWWSCSTSLNNFCGYHEPQKYLYKNMFYNTKRHKSTIVLV